jgi:polyphosphate kinase
MLEIQWTDNVKARIVDAQQENQHKQLLPGKKKIRAQEAIYEYLGGKR